MVGDTVITVINNLGWMLDKDSMAQKVFITINNRIKFLARIYRFLDEEAMKMLLGALVQCHYNYACSS